MRENYREKNIISSVKAVVRSQWTASGQRRIVLVVVVAAMIYRDPFVNSGLLLCSFLSVIALYARDALSFFY